MKLNKAINRDKKRRIKIHGMREDGRSNKLLERLKRERAIRIKKEREQKETLLSQTD